MQETSQEESIGHDSLVLRQSTGAYTKHPSVSINQSIANPINNEELNMISELTVQDNGKHYPLELKEMVPSFIPDRSNEPEKF